MRQHRFNSLFYNALIAWHTKCSDGVRNDRVRVPHSQSPKRTSMVATIRSPKTLAALAFAALIPTAGLAQTPTPATDPARAGLDLHRKRRPLLPVRVSRNLADQRKAGGAGRLRPGTQERVLRRNVGVERQLDRRRLRDSAESAAGAVGEHGVGLLRRLQGQPADGLRLRPRRPLLLLPGLVSGRLHQAEHDGALRGALVEVAVVQIQLQRRQQDLRPSQFARFAIISISPPRTTSSRR